MPPPCGGIRTSWRAQFVGTSQRTHACHFRYHWREKSHMFLCHPHVWGITVSMFPPCVGRQVNICIYVTFMCGVSWHLCFLRCGETDQHMHLCHLHVWGMTASMFPLRLGRQVIIFIYATSMRGVGSDACVFSSCVGRQANICIYATSM